MVINIWRNCYYKQEQEKRNAVISLQLMTMEKVPTLYLGKSHGITLLYPLRS